MAFTMHRALRAQRGAIFGCQLPDGSVTKLEGRGDAVPPPAVATAGPLVVTATGSGIFVDRFTAHGRLEQAQTFGVDGDAYVGPIVLKPDGAFAWMECYSSRLVTPASLGPAPCSAPAISYIQVEKYDHHTTKRFGLAAATHGLDSGTQSLATSSRVRPGDVLTIEPRSLGPQGSTITWRQSGTRRSATLY